MLIVYAINKVSFLWNSRLCNFQNHDHNVHVMFAAPLSRINTRGIIQSVMLQLCEFIRFYLNDILWLHDVITVSDTWQERDYMASQAPQSAITWAMITHARVTWTYTLHMLCLHKLQPYTLWLHGFIHSTCYIRKNCTCYGWAKVIQSADFQNHSDCVKLYNCNCQPLCDSHEFISVYRHHCDYFSPAQIHTLILRNYMKSYIAHPVIAQVTIAHSKIAQESYSF